MILCVKFSGKNPECLGQPVILLREEKATKNIQFRGNKRQNTEKQIHSLSVVTEPWSYKRDFCQIYIIGSVQHRNLQVLYTKYFPLVC